MSAPMRWRLGNDVQSAEYCETDVVNTYRVWLRYELFRGRLGEGEYQASERSLADFIGARVSTKGHLNRLVQEENPGTEESIR